MSFNGSGSFLINTAGQPVVSGTVISSTAFNALTADLATGLSTCITKDGQTTVTANIPMANYKFTGLGAGSGAADSANLSQVQSTVVKLLASVSGTDTITAVGSPTVAAYAAGQMFYFVAAGDNTGAVTINIDSLGAKAVTRDGSVALVAGDIKSGEVVVIVYDGTRFQVVSQLNSSGDARFANVSIASALNVGGVATFSAGTAAAPAITTTGDTNTGIFFPAADTIAFAEGGAEALRIDSSGNLGLGVTPSAWGSSAKAIQFSGGGALWSAGNVQLGHNVYSVPGTNEYYIANGAASRYYQSAGAHVWDTAASGTAGNAITFTQAMTLTAGGNLLVGTTSGTATITANASGGATIRALRESVSATNHIQMEHDGTNGKIAVSGANALLFDTNSTERARITSGGYFKASNAGTYLDATGAYHELRNTANNATVVITNTNGAFSDDLVYGNTSTAAGTGFKLIRLDSNSVEQFRVRGDGTIFAQNTTVQSLSDLRLKENISDANEGLSVITALRPVRYDWKTGYGNNRKNQLGFIAQEVETVFPDAVSVWEMDEPTGEVDDDGTPITEKVDYKTVGPGALIPVLVKAIQEQQALIKSLEAKVAALEAK